MIDYFAVLNQPRRPWLDPDALKARFLALSSDVHPDRFHNAAEPERQAANQRYLELNSAFKCLADHKERVLHLIELETGAKPPPTQRIPADLMDMFMEVGQICKSADTFLAEKARATSPLAKAGLFEKGMEWSDRVAAIQVSVNSLHSKLVAVLKAIDADWDLSPGPEGRQQLIPGLERLYREFGYVNRWTEQLQERIVQLSF